MATFLTIRLLLPAGLVSGGCESAARKYCSCNLTPYMFNINNLKNAVK